jgi:RNA polymerase primary sigma factor
MSRLSRAGDRRSSVLTDYLNEIDQTPLLTEDQERAIAERIAEGDVEARDYLVRANLRLVVRIACDFSSRGLSIEDLIADGNLGLLRAAESFNPEYKVRFSTYAGHWIRQSMRRALQMHGRFVRLPAHAHTLLTKWRRASTTLASQLNRQPTEQEIAAALHLPARKLKLVRAVVEAAALARLRDDEPDSRVSEDLILRSIDEREVTAEDRVSDAEDMARMLQTLGSLDERASDVIRLRFGLDGEPRLTLRQVGDRMGLTYERVRQIERATLAELSREVTQLPPSQRS